LKTCKIKLINIQVNICFNQYQASEVHKRTLNLVDNYIIHYIDVMYRYVQRENVLFSIVLLYMFVHFTEDILFCF